MAVRTKKVRLLKNTYKPHKENSRKVLDDVEDEIPASVKGVKENHIPPRKEWTKQNRSLGTPYGKFLWKFDHLDDETIEGFTTQDLCFYFREIANQNGYRYHLIYGKDGALIKRLREDYSAKEICGMIEFLYMSDQDYLDKSRLSIGVLCSRWVNTIFPDYELWMKDEYTPNKKQKQRNDREWDSKEEKSGVEEW